MKFFRIIILLMFVVSFIPLDAFCDDHHETTEHHDGIVLCHTSCHGAVLTGNHFTDLPDLFEASFILHKGFIYEAPFLPTEERPPLV